MAFVISRIPWGVHRPASLRNSLVLWFLFPTSHPLERVPTKQEVAEREVEVRKAMLLAEEKRAEAMLKFEAEDAERNREREIAEQKRRRQAATGIYQCLLALKQPVQAAEAARVRLAMCETKEEIRQVNQRATEGGDIWGSRGSQRQETRSVKGSFPWKEEGGCVWHFVLSGPSLDICG